jgi:hypothetical protein
MGRYQTLAPDGKEQLPAWIAVMAAARVNEEITHEMPTLLKIVKDGML